MVLWMPFAIALLIPNLIGVLTLFSMCVREHVMIAHSFSGEVFGPAQNLHGATYVVDAVFYREELDADGIVADIGRATEALKDILAAINFRNLDDVAAFQGRNSTTEVIAAWVFEQLAQGLRDGQLGESARAVCRLKVKLNESHVAWAAYEGDPRDHQSQ